MSRRKRGSGPERRRRQQLAAAQRRPAASAADQRLLQMLRTALRSDHPLDLLIVVSGYLEVTDPRNRGPFDHEERRSTVDELVESFIGTPFAETTAALTVLHVLVSDESTAVRIGRALELRTHPLPRWLAALRERGSTSRSVTLAARRSITTSASRMDKAIAHRGSGATLPPLRVCAPV